MLQFVCLRGLSTDSRSSISKCNLAHDDYDMMLYTVKSRIKETG